MSTFKERLEALGFSSYAAYLTGEHWQDFRRRYNSSGRKIACAVCNTPVDLALHHITYERLGGESFDDVIPLCHGHHKAVHDHLKKNSMRVWHTSKAIRALRKKGRKVETTEARSAGVTKKQLRRKKRELRKSQKRKEKSARKIREARCRTFMENFQTLRCRPWTAGHPLFDRLDRLVKNGNEEELRRRWRLVKEIERERLRRVKEKMKERAAKGS